MKSLIIYFSHTGENYMKDGIRNITKGNTEIVSEKIKEITNADLYKVIPKEKYPYSYEECCDVAKEELQYRKRPKIINPLESIKDYDIVYIGGPVWWGHYPCPLIAQLEQLNFAGKIIKPFTTHEGSELGDTQEDIQKHTKGAIIKEGLAIRGCEAEISEKIIESWCNL